MAESEHEPKTRLTLAQIWEIVDKLMPDDMLKSKWHRCYDGISLALKEIDLTMEMTQEEFDAIEVPKDKKGSQCYSYRKIIVGKNGVKQKPTDIKSILMGHTNFATAEELKKTRDAMAMKQHLSRSGKLVSQQLETNATLQLDKLLQMDQDFVRVDLLEFRRADVAYCQIDDDVLGSNFAADQIKSASSSKAGGFNFNTNVEDIIAYLKSNITVTFIGKDTTGELAVVWYFDPIDGMKMLKKFDLDQDFRPRLNIQRASEHKFSQECNVPLFRYNIKNNADEATRLKQRKIAVMEKLQKQTLEFWNEDLSQVPAQFHAEQISINMTKDACKSVGSLVTRNVEDNSSSVDFRIDDHIRVQDKSVTISRPNFRFRTKRPYNPDNFDILQLTFADQKKVYAIPMRKLENNKIVSTFTDEQLMMSIVKIDKVWREQYKKNHFDLKVEQQIRQYLQICRNASHISQLTDRNFYSKILEENDHKFGGVKIQAQKLLKLQPAAAEFEKL